MMNWIADETASFHPDHASQIALHLRRDGAFALAASSMEMAAIEIADIVSRRAVARPAPRLPQGSAG